MIFYFSGTGNSEYAARMLAHPGETLISIGQAVKEQSFSFSIDIGERIVYVFPVYFGGLPLPVREFLSHLRLLTEGTCDPSFRKEVTAVVTCGGTSVGIDQIFQRALSSCNQDCKQVFSVLMPDNYFPGFQMASEKEEFRILEDADKSLREIASAMDNSSFPEPDSVLHTGSSALQQSLSQAALYDEARRTSHFWVDEQCVSCHACEKRCPVNAIQLIDGVPTWVKDSCALCLGCARCGAIHYDQADKTNGRYKHPIYRKQKPSCCT